MCSCDKQNLNEEKHNDTTSGLVKDGKFVIGTRYGVYTCNNDGTEQKKVFSADTLYHYDFVQWFPKKDKVLFIANSSGVQTNMPCIFIMNSDGSNIKCISKGYYDNSPILSPDGVKIVANITDKGVCILDLDGTILKILTPEYGSQASWSPDNKNIIFTTGTYKNNLKVFDTDGGEIISTYINNGLRSFQWSSDSKKIVAINYWGDKGDICLFEYQSLIQDKMLNDSNLIVLTHTGEENNPCFSPDGSKIAFESRRDDNEEIYIMDIDGKNQKRVIVTTEYEYKPSWAADGTKIFFYKNGNGHNLFSINLDGSDLNQITSDISDFRYITYYDCDL